MGPATRRRLSLWAVITGAAVVVAAAYTTAVNEPMIAGAVGGLLVGGGIAGFELFFLQQPVGDRLRRMSMPRLIAVQSVFVFALILLTMHLAPLLLGFGIDGLTRMWRNFGQHLVVALLFAFTVSFTIRVVSLIGARVLFNFLLGRYHRPVEEVRVFLFLDLIGSTTMAEQLGMLTYQSVARRFFFDINRPIAAHGGEIYQYVGDEIVVTWPLRKALRRAACVRCVLDIRAAIDARAEAYRRDFGVVPDFRVGLHCGPVVACEVGDERRAIVYFGDTINTAARLEHLCKEKDRKVLISGPLLDQLKLPRGLASEGLGDLALKGKADSVPVFALEPAALRAPEPRPGLAGPV